MQIFRRGFLLKDLPWVWCFLMRPRAGRKKSRFLSNFLGLRQSLPSEWDTASKGIPREQGISFCQAGELPVLAKDLQPWLGRFWALVHVMVPHRALPTLPGLPRALPQSSLLPSLPLLPTAVGTTWIWGLWDC